MTTFDPWLRYAGRRAQRLPRVEREPLMRLMQAVRRVVSKALLILFIFAMAVLPLPMIPFMAFLLRQPPRRSHPTMVQRRREGEEPE